MFQGEIGRLLLFAGQGCSGKTTFLNNTRKYLPVLEFPDHLEDFHDLAARHVNILSLKAQSQQCYENLCLHVDLWQPIRQYRPSPQNRADITRLIRPALYETWQELAKYARRASTVDIVTYFVRREVHFSRWLYDKGMAQHGGGNVMRLFVAVCGDSTGESELHRGVYRAWNSYAEALKPRAMAVIDANSQEYSFMRSENFLYEIENAYR